MESYWNAGSVKTQGRWFDNFIISTEPIGPVVCPANPVLYKTPYSGPAKLVGWEVELASDFEGKDVVFKSNIQGSDDRITINETNGRFSGTLNGKMALDSGQIYFARVRQKSSTGEWSDWSRWHQGFRGE